MKVTLFTDGFIENPIINSLLYSLSLHVNEPLPLQAQQAIKNETARAEAMDAFSEKCLITNIKVAGDLLVCKQVKQS